MILSLETHGNVGENVNDFSRRYSINWWHEVTTDYRSRTGSRFLVWDRSSAINGYPKPQKAVFDIHQINQGI